MTRHVALLRGINVGRAKRVAMADLRGLLESLGYTDVRTLLNSGNAVFAAPARASAPHAERIQSALAATLGIDALVIVKSAADIAAVIAGNPLARIATDQSRLLVAFTGGRPSLAALAPLRESGWSPEALHVGEHAAYLWCPGGIAESPLVSAVAGALGGSLTTRNWATVEKIDAMLRA